MKTMKIVRVVAVVLCATALCVAAAAALSTVSKDAVGGGGVVPPPPVASANQYTPIPMPTCQGGLKTCAVYGIPYSTACYNASAGQSCCGAHDQDCAMEQKVAVCGADETCCSSGCEHGGTPKCCPANSICCNGGLDTSVCAGEGDKCCDSPGYSSACPKETECCSNLYGSSCCGKNQACCQFKNGQQSQCCEPGQHCDQAVGCLRDECTVIASATVHGPVLHSAVVNSSDACCELCARAKDCKAAVATLMHRSHSEEELFIANLAKHVMSTSRREYLESAGRLNILCEVKGSAAVVPKRDSTVLLAKRNP